MYAFMHDACEPLVASTKNASSSSTSSSLLSSLNGACAKLGLLLINFLGIILTLQLVSLYSPNLTFDGDIVIPNPKLPPTIESIAYGESTYAVTKVKIISDKSMDAAIRQCESKRSSKWTTAGVDLDNDPKKFAILCKYRELVQEIRKNPKATVLRRIEILTETLSSQCPSSMKLLYTPRTGVVVCVETVQASSVLSSGDYLADVAVDYPEFYNLNEDGWTSNPTSIHIPSTNKKDPIKEVTLSYNRFISPIVELKFVSEKTRKSIYQACDSLKKPSSVSSYWETVGYRTWNQTVDVLCARRDVTATTSILLDAVKPDNFTTCPVRTKTLKTPSGSVICATFGDGTTNFFVINIHFSTPITSSKSSVITLSQSKGIDITIRKSTQRPLGLPNAEVLPSTNNDKPPLVAKAQNDSFLSFRVMQFADLHIIGNSQYPCRSPPVNVSGCTELVVSKFMRDLLLAEKPDFVVFTGDTIQPTSVQAIDNAFEVATKEVEALKIPWAFVLGNHDDDNTQDRMTAREKIFELALQKKYCYASRGPQEVAGVGNYILDVQAPTTGKWGLKDDKIFRMYFLDSHGFLNKKLYPKTTSKYGWIQPSQVNYYQTLSDQTQSDPIKKNPALMFFHIPLVEYKYDTLLTRNGVRREVSATSAVNSGFFSTLADYNEVKAIFVGHDHTNTMCYRREGINLCYGGLTGFGFAYADPTLPRRSRVIEWSVNDKNQRLIRSWKRHFGQVDKIKDMEILYSENPNFNVDTVLVPAPTPKAAATTVKPQVTPSTVPTSTVTTSTFTAKAFE